MQGRPPLRRQCTQVNAFDGITLGTGHHPMLGTEEGGPGSFYARKGVRHALSSAIVSTGERVHPDYKFALADGKFIIGLRS